MKIRQATITDAFEIEHVHRDAFGEAEGPVVGTLAKVLMNGVDDDRSIAFVAESDDRVVTAVCRRRDFQSADNFRARRKPEHDTDSAGCGHSFSTPENRTNVGSTWARQSEVARDRLCRCIRRPSLLFAIWIHANSSIGCTVQFEIRPRRG